MIRDKDVRTALDTVEHEFAAQEQAIESLQDIIERLENQLQDKNSHIDSLEEQVKSLEEALMEAHLTSEAINETKRVD